jgi:hypothetical protein
MPEPAFDLSAHASTVIAEREIDIAWIESTLANPERIEPDRGDASLKHALARIPERGDRVLRVVYNASYAPPLVVTAYFDRGQRGKP